MVNRDVRSRAIRDLTRLQSELEQEEELHPGQDALTSAHFALAYDEALLILYNELGESFVQSNRYSTRDIIPKSRVKGGAPEMDSVGRAPLLNRVRETLKRLNLDEV